MQNTLLPNNEWSLLEHRRSWLLVLVAAVVVGLSFQGSRGIYESTEGRYSLCALEMFRRGDWLKPTLHGEPHWSKPPFTYWALAAGIALLGSNEWAVRIPVALGFIVSTMGVVWLASCLWDRRTGIAAGLIYATSPYPGAVGSTVSTDTFTAMWQILAAAAYWSACRASTPRGSAWRVLWMWLFLGLGFFTKGPPANLVLIPILLYHFAGNREGVRFSLFRPLPLLIFAVTGLWWYLLMVIRQPELCRYFVGYEVVDRMVSDVHGRNPEWHTPFTLYVPVIVFGAGLWSWFWWRRIANRQAVASAKTWQNREARQQGFFLAAWLLPNFLLFALVHSRLPSYLLPVFTVLPLTAAHALCSGYRPVTVRRLVIGLSLAAGGLLIAGKATMARIESNRDMRPLYLACRTVDSPRAIYLPIGAQLNGLAFYVRGEFTFTSDQTTLRREIRRHHREMLNPDRDRLVIITGNDHAEFVTETVMEASPRPPQIFRTSFYTVLVLDTANLDSFPNSGGRHGRHQPGGE